MFLDLQTISVVTDVEVSYVTPLENLTSRSLMCPLVDQLVKSHVVCGLPLFPGAPGALRNRRRCRVLAFIYIWLSF